MLALTHTHEVHESTYTHTDTHLYIHSTHIHSGNAYKHAQITLSLIHTHTVMSGEEHSVAVIEMIEGYLWMGFEPRQGSSGRAFV